MYTLSRIEFDNGIIEEIVKLYQSIPTRIHGRCNTWHSQRTRTNSHPWFDSTFNAVKESIGELDIREWWFNVAEPGEEYRWHEHNPYTSAAVLYLQVPDNSGAIEFRKYEEYQTFTPTGGDFIVFPGNLTHRVLTNNSADYRISVAFNLR